MGISLKQKTTILLSFIIERTINGMIELLEKELQIQKALPIKFILFQLIEKSTIFL
jgi:hypothetical protein